MNSTDDFNDIVSPYPGLRPFRQDEADFFFGREEQIEQLLATLETHHFLAVLGPSGCGKSSLVKAGLLPMLEHGFMADAGPKWRMATMRPGNAPFDRLTEALLADSALGPERDRDAAAFNQLEATLRRGRFGVVDAVLESLLPADTNLLLLVDQFEEIFRYRQKSSIDEAEAFVNLLLAASRHPGQEDVPDRTAPVYVIITMRSDFFGECALFLGLPEAINECEFLTPRLSREQCRAAVVGPARILGGDLDPPLVNCLLNDMRADTDPLPLLQHVLMRMWTNAATIPPRLTLEDLETTGGLRKALSNHADVVLGELNAERKRIAQVMFRCLCEMESDRRVTRRLATLGDVAEVAEVSPDEVQPVTEVFRRPGCSFLMPPPGTPINQDTLLDISHESLIRQWGTLSQWVADEEQSASTYRRLLETARLWEQGKARLWSTPDLEIAEKWKADKSPNVAWARRYGGDFELTMKFLDASVEGRERAARRHRRNVRLAVAASLLVAIGSIAFGVIALNLRQAAYKQREIAVEERKRADKLRVVAEVQRAEAVKSREIAEQQKQRAKRSEYSAQLAGIQESVLIDANAAAARLNDDRVFPPELREFSWQYFDRLSAAQPDRLTRKRVAHEHPVRAVASYPNANPMLLASGYADGIIILWDLETGQEVRRLSTVDGSAAPVTCIVFSPSGETLASAHDDETIRTWDVDQGTERWSIPSSEVGGRVRALAYSPDGAVLASGGDNYAIRLWDPDQRQLTKTLERHTNWVSCLAFSSDGDFLASGSFDTTVLLWDVKNSGRDRPMKKLHGHTNSVRSLCFCLDDEFIASGGEDNCVRLWDVRDVQDPTGQPGVLKPWMTLEGHTSHVHAVACAADGKTLASGSNDGTIKFWNLKPVDEPLTVRRHLGPVHDLVYLSTVKRFASAGNDGIVMIWDPETGLEQPRLSDDLGPVRSVAYSPSSEEIVTASKNGTVQLWKFSPNSVLTPSHPLTHDASGGVNSPWCVAISLDGKLVAAGHDNGAITLWSRNSTKDTYETKPLAAPQNNSKVNSLAFNPTGAMLAAAREDGTIALWDLKSSETRPLKNNHIDAVKSVAFSRDGKWLASGSVDQTVLLWDCETWDHALLQMPEEPAASPGKSKGPMPSHDDWVLCVAFSHDGRFLASAGDDRKIKIWDVASRELVGTAVGHRNSVTTVLFSPDNRTLVSGSLDHTVRLWDPELGVPRGILRGHTGGVRSIAFCENESALVSVGDDSTVRIWLANDPVRETTTTDVAPTK